MRPVGYGPGLKIELPRSVTAKPAQQSQELPIRPLTGGSLSGMSKEQQLDFVAACEGKITWQQYFRKWGNALGGGPEL